MLLIATDCPPCSQVRHKFVQEARIERELEAACRMQRGVRVMSAKLHVRALRARHLQRTHAAYRAQSEAQKAMSDPSDLSWLAIAEGRGDELQV